MKILVITTSNFKQNGITSVIMNYYRMIRNKKDISMDFVSPNLIDDLYQKEFHENKSVYYYLGDRRSNPILYMYRLYNILKTNKYDIVHIHGSSHLMAIELFISKLARIKVRIAHSHNTQCDHILLHKLLTPLFNFSYTQALSCGEEAGKWLFGNKNFIIINNGINLNQFKFDSFLKKQLKQELKLNDQDIVIGHIAGFLPAKNHQFIINFAEFLNNKQLNYKFLLLGDGELFEEIKFQIEEKKLQNNIILLGSRKDIYRFYNVMDVFILPSFHEGLPVVLIEAQANGLKSIVSSNVTSQADLTENLCFCSIVENTQNFELWRKNVDTHILDTKDRLENSKKAIEKLTLKNYDVKSNSNQLYQLYQSLKN